MLIVLVLVSFMVRTINSFKPTKVHNPNDQSRYSRNVVIVFKTITRTFKEFRWNLEKYLLSHKRSSIWSILNKKGRFEFAPRILELDFGRLKETVEQWWSRNKQISSDRCIFIYLGKDIRKPHKFLFHISFRMTLQSIYFTLFGRLFLLTVNNSRQHQTEMWANT